MAHTTRRFGRLPEPDPVDYLALFPSEAAERGDIADFPAESSPIHASRAVPCARTAAPATVLAVSTPWLVCLLLLVPSLVTLLLFRTPSAVSTLGDLAPDVTVGTTVAAHRRLNVEVAPDLARPSPALRKEADAIVIPAPMEVTPTLGPRPRTANVTGRVQGSPHTERVTSKIDPALSLAPPPMLDITLVGENAPTAVPPTVNSPSVDRGKFFGSLSVSSQPAGAQVLIDGRPVGVTPFQSELRAGSHVVRVELDGYSRWSAPVQIITAKTLNLLANLQPAQPPD